MTAGFGVNIRKAYQAVWGTCCEWEFGKNAGEEEHGVNPGRRHCAVCGKCQKVFYSRFAETPVSWEDDL